MARTVPKTKRAKQAKIAEVLSEFKHDALHSSSGEKVKSRKQAIAIALESSGQARKKGKK